MMNARTTTLLIVLALALAACVAPMPAPPAKAPTAPEMEQPVLIPSTQNEKNQNLPAVNDPWSYPDYVNEIWDAHLQKVKDAEAARLLAAQQALTDKLMTGLPMQIRDDIAIYAAMKVAEVAIAPESMTTYPDIIRGVLAGTMKTTPYVLPEQKATNPKSREVQAMDDLLKPEMLPAESLATKIAVLEHAALTVPPQVRAAIYEYIDALQLPASQMPARDQWYLEEKAPVNTPAEPPYWQQPWHMPPATTPADMTQLAQQLEFAAAGTPPQVQLAIHRYAEDLKLPATASGWVNTYDSWYLEEMNYVNPATEPR